MSETSVQITQPVISINFPASGTGPQGPPGPAGGTSVTYTAGENLSSGRAVIIDNGEAFYFQPSDPAHVGRVMGLTVTSASTGNDVDIQLSGTVTDAAFTFTPDLPVFARADGELFNTPGTSGTAQYIGVAVSADTLILNIGLFIVQS